MAEVFLDLLVGTPVRDPDGALAGRIQEVRAETRDGETVITEYLIGPAALLARLSALPLAAPLLRLFGGGRDTCRRVPWDQMDLSDPRAPRLLCPARDLPPLTGADE